jgi:hypothetical protein
MCRQYNDYGSVARDREEKNLNSLDFEEFRSFNQSGGPVDDSNAVAKTSGASNGHSALVLADETKDEAKGELMAIAEFERLSMELAFGKLGSVVEDTKVMRKLKVFVDVTDTFGQMYVQKDFSSRKV